MRKVLLGVMLAALIGLGALYGIAYQQEVASANAAQLLKYQNAILADQNAILSHPLANTSSPGTALPRVSASLAMFIGTKDASANHSLMAKGFVPDCLSQCAGITYYRDPTSLITNEGVAIMEQYFAGTCSGPTGCSSYTGTATIEGLSTSGSAANVADTFTTASAMCGIANIVLASSYNSLAPQVGTPAIASPSAGSVTWTVSNTWTYSIGTATVAGGCLFVGTSSSFTTTGTSGTIGIFAESSGWGPFTLAPTNTLQEVWTVVAT